MRRVFSLVLLLSVMFPTLVASAPARAAACEFTLGFKTLHDAIPNIVGSCLDDASFDTGVNEALQVTTGTRTDGGFGGLLVWRKGDNLVWFTDGVNTWITTPQGIQRRPNTERFPWELDTLENAAYNLDNTPFVLNQGRAELITDTPQIIRLSAGLDKNHVAYGDLNGDGVTDAAVVLVVNTGGSGVFNHLAAMVTSTGRPQQAATTLLGDRVVINAVSVDNGLITVDMITQGPNEPLCCPTVPKTVTFRLVDGQLQELTR